VQLNHYIWSLSLILFSPLIAGDWIHERIEKTITTSPGQEIYISNRYGDINLRSKEGAGIDVIAHFQKEKGYTGFVKYFEKVEEGILHFEVLFPEEKKENAKFKKRVDLTFFIPKHSRITIQGKDGTIAGKGLDNPMTITTRNGNIGLRNDQSAKITTYQGNIEYFIQADTWSTPISLESTIGSTVFWVPDPSNATITASTKGDITSDFTTTITSKKDQFMKHASITLGSGDSKILIRSVQGNIRIKKQIKNSSY
jgi:hypothetical protein